MAGLNRKCDRDFAAPSKVLKKLIQIAASYSGTEEKVKGTCNDTCGHCKKQKTEGQEESEEACNCDEDKNNDEDKDDDEDEENDDDENEENQNLHITVQCPPLEVDLSPYHSGFKLHLKQSSSSKMTCHGVPNCCTPPRWQSKQLDEARQLPCQINPGYANYLDYQRLLQENMGCSYRQAPQPQKSKDCFKQHSNTQKNPRENIFRCPLIQHRVPQENTQYNQFEKKSCNSNTGVNKARSAAITPDLESTESPETCKSCQLKAERKENDKELKKKAESKTSIKSKSPTITCVCPEKRADKPGCQCHFPPAYSQYYNCMGNITGHCTCEEFK